MIHTHNQIIKYKADLLNILKPAVQAFEMSSMITFRSNNMVNFPRRNRRLHFYWRIRSAEISANTISLRLLSFLSVFFWCLDDYNFERETGLSLELLLSR